MPITKVLDQVSGTGSSSALELGPRKTKDLTFMWINEGGSVFGSAKIQISPDNGTTWCRLGRHYATSGTFVEYELEQVSGIGQAMVLSRVDATHVRIDYTAVGVGAELTVWIADL